MKTLFTIHAGEYLVATALERNFPNFNIWLPSKDTGIDLLLTDKLNNNKKIRSLQVKFSKSFSDIGYNDDFNLKYSGWFNFNRKKLINSQADFWIIVLHSFENRNPDFLIIKPFELLNIYDKTNRSSEVIYTYVWLTKNLQAFETRGLKKSDQLNLINGKLIINERDLTKYLNNWSRISNVK